MHPLRLSGSGGRGSGRAGGSGSAGASPSQRGQTSLGTTTALVRKSCPAMARFVESSEVLGGLLGPAPSKADQGDGADREKGQGVWFGDGGANGCAANAVGFLRRGPLGHPDSFAYADRYWSHRAG